MAAHVLQISHHVGRLVIWQFGQNETLQIASPAPGAKTMTRPRHSEREAKNEHFRRQIQSSLAPEVFIWNRNDPFLEPKGTKKHPEKNCQAFPLVLRVKNQRIAAGKQPKKLTSVSPLQGF
jgi:hypothetical protein